MINVTKILKFYYPYLEVWKEKSHTLSILNEMEMYLLYHEIEFKKKETSDENYSYVKYISKNFKVSVAYLDSDIVNNYIPLFIFDIFYENGYEDANIIHGLLSGFDGLDEENYLCEVDKDIKNALTRDYQFVYVDEIFDKYQNENIEKTIQNFFENRKNQMYAEFTDVDSFGEFKNLLMFFLYNYYSLIMFLSNAKGLSKEIENVVIPDFDNSDYYRGHLDLLSKRLGHIEDISYVTINKYKKYLDSFFELIEKNQ